MKNDEQYNVGLRFEGYQVLDYEDKIVERNEANNPDEVRIDQFSATYLSIRHEFLNF